MIRRHSDACDCPTCLRHYQQRTLWLGSIFVVLAGVSAASVAVWLYRLMTGGSL